MKSDVSSPQKTTHKITRRRFVHGLAAGSVLASMPGLLQARSAIEGVSARKIPVLSGKQIDLVIDQIPVNFTGVPRMATAINGSIPAPTLYLREGDEVTIRVTNRLPVSTSIHWHGILLPFEMDGVPGISFPGIAPGQTFTYRFRLRQSGTYWYHSHSGFQEMTGLYGALIVEPREHERFQSNRTHIIQLSDWTDADPEHLFDKIRIQSDIYNFNQPTLTDFVRDARHFGLASAISKRRMWNLMRMNPTDLADLSGAVLTFLMNGTTPTGNWTGLFKPGERVRLRFINASSNTFYDVRIPGLKLTIIQADGQDLEPVTVDEFRFGPGETYDAIVTPVDDAYTVFAQSMDRTGYARGTLAIQEGLTAPVPDLDPVPWLTMTDMMGGMNHDTVKMGDHDMPAMRSVRHASSEFGPSTDMRVDVPRTNLDDPGVGLRNNGRRVLTFADLHSVDGILDDTRQPDREIELHLTGNMERYSWSLDGLEFGRSTPISMRQGERLRVILHNDTMMTHPMHLHGMWSDVESPSGELLVRRHTVSVQPAQRITFLTTPNDLGRWAWHCHLLFHMDAGMFREVVVS